MPSTDSAGLKVLVVDDDSDTATMEALLLGLEKHSVTIVSDGSAALLEIQRETPDVVLLDIGMPGLDGHEVAKRIHDMRLRNRPMLIAVSGRGDAAAIRRSQDVGFDMHLVKPVPPQTLCSLLRQVATILH
jgi:CheY-like chemotaxis protein